MCQTLKRSTDHALKFLTWTLLVATVYWVHGQLASPSSEPQLKIDSNDQTVFVADLNSNGSSADGFVDDTNSGTLGNLFYLLFARFHIFFVEESLQPSHKTLTNTPIRGPPKA